jgi:L-alanine-DL-glutamate epimerase-like enolase superfamily enzyme
VAKLWAVGAAGAGGIGEATGVAGSLSTWGCHMGPVASCRATAAVPHATDKANCEAIEAERGRGWDGGPGVDELATAARCAAVTKAVGGGAACTWLSATDVKA